MRGKYWRTKFASEALEMDDDDHNDLCNLFEGVAESVPDDFKFMWEQQRRILATQTKQGYRWHPK